jgi:hypothetical protein
MTPGVAGSQECSRYRDDAQPGGEVTDLEWGTGDTRNDIAPYGALAAAHG